MLCITEVRFMLRATSKWRRRRSGHTVSELLVLGRWTVGQFSALHFSDSVGKPRAMVVGENQQLHSHWRTEPQTTWKTRQEGISVLSKRQGVVSGSKTQGLAKPSAHSLWAGTLEWRQRHSTLLCCLQKQGLASHGLPATVCMGMLTDMKETQPAFPFPLLLITISKTHHHQLLA